MWFSYFGVLRKRLSRRTEGAKEWKRRELAAKEVRESKWSKFFFSLFEKPGTSTSTHSMESPASAARFFSFSLAFFESEDEPSPSETRREWGCRSERGHDRRRRRWWCSDYWRAFPRREVIRIVGSASRWGKEWGRNSTENEEAINVKLQW